MNEFIIEMMSKSVLQIILVFVLVSVISSKFYLFPKASIHSPSNELNINNNVSIAPSTRHKSVHVLITRNTKNILNESLSNISIFHKA